MTHPPLLPTVNPWLLTLDSFGLVKKEENNLAAQSDCKDIFDFTIGDPQEPTPQFICQALRDGIDEISQYPQSAGSLDLRLACAAWLLRRTGVSVDAQSEVISSNGSKEAIFHIPQLLLNVASARRLVVFPEPGYPVYRSGTVLAGGLPYAYVLRQQDGYVFRPERIPDELLPSVAAVWLCSPHNPTGAVTTLQEMEKIYEWSLKHGIVLLSDECYLDLFFAGSDRPHSFLEVAKDNGFQNLLCFFSLSKRSGMTGYRSGFVAGSAALLSAFRAYRLHVGVGTPSFVQKAAIAAWQDDQHVRERCAVFQAKSMAVADFFLRNGLCLLESKATLYVWGAVPPSFASGRQFADTLFRATGILVTPGEVFGSSCARHFRMALVPPLEEINRCLLVWQQKIETGCFKI